MGPAPGGLAGELTPLLANEYPTLITDVAASASWHPSSSPSDFDEPIPSDFALDVVDGTCHVHDFTSVSQYGSVEQPATMAGRIYGPARISYCEIATRRA